MTRTLPLVLLWPVLPALMLGRISVQTADLFGGEGGALEVSPTATLERTSPKEVTAT